MAKRREACPRCGQPTDVVDGLYLRRLRERAGLSLREMGRKIKLSAPYLSAVERNKRRATGSIVSAYEKLK